MRVLHHLLSFQTDGFSEHWALSSRYIAVCAPFFRLRHNIKARFYILPILLFAPLYNSPRFFVFRTVSNVTYTCLNTSEFRPNSSFAEIQEQLQAQLYDEPVNATGEMKLALKYVHIGPRRQG